MLLLRRSLTIFKLKEAPVEHKRAVFSEKPAGTASILFILLFSQLFKFAVGDDLVPADLLGAPVLDRRCLISALLQYVHLRREVGGQGRERIIEHVTDLFYRIRLLHVPNLHADAQRVADVPVREISARRLYREVALDDGRAVLGI